MSKRISTIVKYIDKKDIVLDIGCDSAILSIYLAKNKIKSYASDIKENIIKSDELIVKEMNLEDYVTLIVSDGLKNIDESLPINTLVLAGMGTHTILEILNVDKKYDKIITISNNDYYILRKEMMGRGYIIDKEEIIYDKDKYYNLIIFKPGKKEYTEKELIVGVNHQNKKELKNYQKFLIEKFSKILSNNLPKESKTKLEKIIKYLK